MAVRLPTQAPPNPSDNNSNGPIQHADAPIPVITANNKERLGIDELDITRSQIKVIWDSLHSVV